VKIIVYNSYEQYALSRAEVEAIRGVLPSKCWARVHELHIAHSHPKQSEAFEFDERSGIAYLIVPVKEKTNEFRAQAVRHLLVGLARITARSRFFLPLKARERAEYEEFVGSWAPKCEAAIFRLHDREA